MASYYTMRHNTIYYDITKVYDITLYIMTYCTYCSDLLPQRLGAEPVGAASAENGAEESMDGGRVFFFKYI